MATYLVRRFIQMILVVLLSTMAIYAILNLAPGGPLSGKKLVTGINNQLSEADIARLENYLGIDKPIVLRYMAWILGDDWLGADSMYLGLTPPKTGRFYTESGFAYTKVGYPIWIAGPTTADPSGRAEIAPTTIWVNPRGAVPETVHEGKILTVTRDSLVVDLTDTYNDTRIVPTATTEWIIPDRPQRPTEGLWLPVGWLFGPQGLLGDYIRFHGDQRGVLRMDWGTSWKVATGQKVSDLILSRLGNTLLLTLTATLFSLLIAIPIGIYSAVKQYSTLDYIITTFTFFGTAMPVFWFGLMMVMIFSIWFQQAGLPYLPAGSLYSLRPPDPTSLLGLLHLAPKSLGDRAVHLLMPALVLSLLYMATWSRFMRASMLEVLRQDYIRTARAKGLAERFVIIRHALRNALIPIITIVVLQIPGLFGGAIITETIFSWTGMGRLFLDALSSSDWPIVMIFLLIEAVLVVISTLVGDVLYTTVDPRIRYD